MSPPHAGHSSGNFSPTRAISLAQAIREVSCERGFWFASPQPPVACSSLACPPVVASRCFPTLPFRQSRDGRPQRVVRRKHSVIAMPVPPRLWDEIRKSVQKLKRRELDDAAGPRLRGLSLSAWPDPALQWDASAVESWPLKACRYSRSIALTSATAGLSSPAGLAATADGPAKAASSWAGVACWLADRGFVGATGIRGCIVTGSSDGTAPNASGSRNGLGFVITAGIGRGG